MIKTVIYDLDDLMVDSLPLHIKANKRLFEELGYDLSVIPENELKKFVGQRVEDFLRAVKKILKIPDEVATLEQILKRKEEIFSEILRKKGIQSSKGLFESIKFFQLTGLKMTLVSSGIKSYIKAILDHLNLQSVFDLIISGDQVRNGKPNPECYLLAKKKLRIKDFEGIVLEDAESGIESALSAKLIAVGVPAPRNFQIQDLSKAHLVIDNLGQINRQFLKKCNQLSEELIRD
jgi:beta-phosphoglucomutase